MSHTLPAIPRLQQARQDVEDDIVKLKLSHSHLFIIFGQKQLLTTMVLSRGGARE